METYLYDGDYGDNDDDDKDDDVLDIEKNGDDDNHNEDKHNEEQHNKYNHNQHNHKKTTTTKTTTTKSTTTKATITFKLLVLVFYSHTLRGWIVSNIRNLLTGICFILPRNWKKVQNYGNYDPTQMAGPIPGSRTDSDHLEVPDPVLELTHTFCQFCVRFCYIFTIGSSFQVPGQNLAQNCSVTIQPTPAPMWWSSL